MRNQPPSRSSVSNCGVSCTHQKSDESSPEAGEIFIHYNVYRDGVRIATADTIAAPTYTDYLAIPGVEHAYTVTWTANVSGDLLESEPQDVPATVTVGFRSGWLHQVDDSTLAHALLVHDASIASEQEVSYRRARGRRLPTAFVGGGRARTLQVTPDPEALGDPALWAFLREVQDRQFTAAAVFCLRFGYRAGERYFVQLDGLDEQHATALDRIRLRFREVHFDEEV